MEVTDFEVKSSSGSWERCSVKINGKERTVICDYDEDTIVVYMEKKTKVLPLSGCHDYYGDIEDYLSECLIGAPNFVQPKDLKERVEKRQRQLFKDFVKSIKKNSRGRLPCQPPITKEELSQYM